MASTAVAVRPAPTARVREKRQRRRAEILHAALRAFRERGYHATTLADIAAHLGIRKTALYHYFRDKEAILYACHRESCAEVCGLLAEAGRRHVTASGQLAWIIREHVRVMTDTLGGSPLAFEVTALSPAHQAGIIAARDEYEQGLRALIVRGMAEGEFRTVNPKTAAFAILGAINWIARWYRPEGSLHAAELGDEFAAHLVGGLARRETP
jgi:AcrR family transcriptional regulator